MSEIIKQIFELSVTPAFTRQINDTEPKIRSLAALALKQVGEIEINPDYLPKVEFVINPGTNLAWENRKVNIYPLIPIPTQTIFGPAIASFQISPKSIVEAAISLYDKLEPEQILTKKSQVGEANFLSTILTTATTQLFLTAMLVQYPSEIVNKAIPTVIQAIESSPLQTKQIQSNY